MDITRQIEIDAPREAVFALYADVASWPLWDKEVEAVHLPDGLRTGSTGWLKAPKGPRANIRVSEVVPGTSFTMEGLLPFCKMRFGHELQDLSGRTTAKHWVVFTGALAFLFRRVIGKGIAATLPDTLLGLKRASEAKG